MRNVDVPPGGVRISLQGALGLGLGLELRLGLGLGI